VSLDELRPILHGYRQQVQQAWSPATAHPGYEGKPGDPAGQCGVTSAWLQRRLLEDHGIETWYCVGDVFHRGRALRDHCWLEIGEGRNRAIADLTVDQIHGAQDRLIICATFRDLCSESVGYFYRYRLTRKQLGNDPVSARLAILEEALS